MQGLLFTDYALAMFGNLSVFHLKKTTGIPYASATNSKKPSGE